MRTFALARTVLAVTALMALLGATPYSGGILRAEASASTATTLFSDDFSGDLSKWRVVTGDWSIQTGELLGHGWGGNVDV